MDYKNLLDRSEEWLQYAIRLHLCHEPKESLVAVRSAALEDHRIQRYLADIANYHATIVTNHKNPDLPIHKLLFLLNLGFGREVPEIKTAVDEIVKHRDENGIYQSMTNIPKHFGGTGEDVFSWCLCDAPLLLSALLKAGMDYPKYVQHGVDYLLSLGRDNGFPCATSPELGRFRGPGRKEDCCPYATLIMADLLSQIPEYRDSSIAVGAATSLLGLWENSLTQHPFIFYMGTDFRKLKAPSNWYDIVSVAGILSNYAFARKDPRFLAMIEHIRGKQDKEGLFTPESIYLKVKDWDFGQKKEPSPYLTFLCYRIFERLNDNA